MDQQKIIITPEKIKSVAEQGELKKLSEQVKKLLTDVFSGVNIKEYKNLSGEEREEETKRLCLMLETNIKLFLQEIDDESKQQFLQNLLQEIEDSSIPMSALRLMPSDLKMAIQNTTGGFMKEK